MKKYCHCVEIQMEGKRIKKTDDRRKLTKKIKKDEKKK